MGKQTKHGALDAYFARRADGGPVFLINTNIAGNIRQTATEWRDTHATNFVRSDVAELRIITPQYAVVCARVENPASGEEWRLAEFAGKVAEGMNLGAAAKTPTALHGDRDRIEELIGKVAVLESVSFLDRPNPKDARYGLNDPSLKIAALDKAGKTLASVSIGARSGPRRFATSDHLNALFQINAADTTVFNKHAVDLASRP